MTCRQWIGAGIAIVALNAAWADTGATGASPQALVPAQVRAAKSVFLSNAGIDATSAWIGYSDASDQAFSLFVQSMQSWGHFQIAAAPADADLVFSLKIEAANLSNFIGAALHLTISDVKTGVTLWTVVTPLKSNSKVAAGMQTLMQSVQTLVK